MIKINKVKEDLLFTFANQIWRLVSGPITMLLIPLMLSEEQQGYWYLFGSISALSVFSDLGFSNIILQFSAHEYAFLHFTNEGFLGGEKTNLQKLGKFFRFVTKWIFTISLPIFPIIFLIGIFFFLKDKVLTVYLLPWTLYAVGSYINFISNSILSFFEGLDKVSTIQKIRLKASILYTVMITLILIAGGYIYALAIGMLLSALFVFISIFREFGKILKQLLKISESFFYDWKKEVFPLFMKYAISFASGYFIYQIYTPLMHYFHGPVYSGKIGISIALVSSINGISYIWLYTITPKINMLISQKKWNILDSLVRKRTILSLGTYLCIVLILFIFLIFFRNFWVIPKIIDRFLPSVPLIICLGSYFINLLLSSWGLYLRGHKKELFVIPSVIYGIGVMISTYLFGKFMPPVWFFTGFLICTICMIPVDYIIYRTWKEKLHG